MKKNRIHLGETILQDAKNRIKGSFVEIEGEPFYRIEHYDSMPDFLMSIVSDSDHWMFISSSGSLSAGRKNRDNALFPYYTDDKIQDYYDLTGSKTIVLVENKGNNYLWFPFSKELAKIYRINRALFKSLYGNKIIFEETNLDLGLKFQYGWFNSDKYGFVKKSRLRNLGDGPVKAEILDGIRNILPSGADYAFQNEYSNLLDAYKKNELIEDTRLGLFTLSSIPVDKAEPSESLNATTVWSYGLASSKILISDAQLEAFQKGLPVETETDVRAMRGAYYVNAELKLDRQQDQEWIIVCEINQSTTDVVNLNQILQSGNSLIESVDADIQRGTTKLVSLVAAADGLQATRDQLSSGRHFSNTLYNIMRGGIYINDYTIDTGDFRKFIRQTNTKVETELGDLLKKFPEEISVHNLLQLAEKSGNINFIRICHEYLPLTFSRRHGDPSRPWNVFSIDTKNEDGSPKTDFQGNWRDIFQNWEALSLSYPEFIENIIAKFVNASTADGYNPYRIMYGGIDWECPDPDDPWAYIGYWGDHQIIYLQKLLELSRNYHPWKIEEMLLKEIFAYANVPYRIKTYSEIIINPQSTIDFDKALNDKIKSLVEEIGADGRLLMMGDRSVYHVNLTEKILVTLLSKLSNFIPEAGIWLNTQRPEWNDANNALVGNGVSMVTLYYLRRFLNFWHGIFENSRIGSVPVSEEVKTLFESIFKLFSGHSHLLKTGFSDKERRNLTDALGKAGTMYRETIYHASFSGNKKSIKIEKLVKFILLTIEFVDQSIDKNKREDGLYHAYNLVSFHNEGISIRHLYKMLEGQVAVLSSGYLSAHDSLELLDSLRQSDLFRPDQFSYLLYPDKQLPRFIKKNNIPKERIEKSELLIKLISDKNTSIINIDNYGQHHFHSRFRNAEILESALDALDNKIYGPLLNKERSMILDIYEEIFDHQSFTGRSGTFFAYEGLGSIYWHMVSKLLLAVQEVFTKAEEGGEIPELISRLKDHYNEIKEGLGVWKSPDKYGAFPTDPYSHTPGSAGVQQPGMTGQVKEDIISRFGELGVKVHDGCISFQPVLLSENEYLDTEKEWNTNGQKINLSKGELGFTLCGTPVIYRQRKSRSIRIALSSGEEIVLRDTNTLDQANSELIFNRTSSLKSIRVNLPVSTT